jgi:UDP-N-acetylglucosamine 2-epimerase (non-hydrolysing)
MKVITVLGTRPEIIRLSLVIKQLDNYTEHIIVHTGQNYDYELNQIFFDDLNIRKPDHFLNAAGSTPMETISNVILKFDRLIEENMPDALLVLGDTNSSLCVIPAKRRKIPIFHMEAGNRCFDLRVPEEINRKIVDHISDINLPYSSIAREYLLREGFPPEQIVKTGSPMFEVLKFYGEKINESIILSQLNLTKGKYFVLSIHREENVDGEQSLRKISQIINEISTKYKYPVLFSLHPRTRERIERFQIQFNPLVQFMSPLGFTDYIKLQKDAYCVISDSGTLTEEASILDFAAINIREVHERPEGTEKGAVILTGLDERVVLDSIQIAVELHSADNRRSEIVNDYSIDNVSHIILKTIIGYTGYINRRVWKTEES